LYHLSAAHAPGVACEHLRLRYNSSVMSKSPRTPKRGITTPRGFAAASCTCGAKPSGQPDLALIAADRPCPAAGVFTTNNVTGAPVVVSKQHLAGRPMIQAIICNSGSANVCTGTEGLRDARSMCDQVARQIGCQPHQVLVCSTGVIGQRLPMDKIGRGIATVVPRLERGPATDAAVARAILTTDLVTKMAYRSVRVDGKLSHLAGIAKGSGMIAPNMATMLAFITTDIAITGALLKRALVQAVNKSLNRISVDHDTSTSDSALILASGAAGNQTIARAGTDYRRLLDALTDLCQDLAYQIVKDGEGATKVFRVTIVGARNMVDADLVGRAIVGSLLVKTAVHGSDPNWGRFLMAAGKSGATLKGDRLSLRIGNQCVLENGQPVSLNRTEQRQLARTMKRKEIDFTVVLKVGRASAQWLGCDLSRQYVTINADYTT